MGRGTSKAPSETKKAPTKVRKIRFSESTQKQCNPGTINVAFGKRDMPFGEYLNYIINFLNYNTQHYSGCSLSHPYLIRQDNGKYCCAATIEKDKVTMAAYFLNVANEILQNAFLNVSDDILCVNTESLSNADTLTKKCTRNYMKIVDLIKQIIEFRDVIYGEYNEQFSDSSPFDRDLHVSTQTKINLNDNLKSKCNSDTEVPSQVPTTQKRALYWFKWLAQIASGIFILYCTSQTSIGGKTRRLKKKKTKRRH